MKKKMLSLLLCAALTTTILAGCSSSEPAAETTGAEAATEAVSEPEETAEEASASAPAAAEEETQGEQLAYTGELEIMHYSTSEESEGNGGSDGFRTVLAQWDEAHPDITLTQNVLANAEYKTQIATLAAADDLPDVFLLQGMNTIDWQIRAWSMI